MHFISTRSLFAVLALALPVVSVHAAKDADLKPILAKPGKSMAEDAFGTSELAKTWTVAKGTAEVKDGTLFLAFKESDHHAAVLMLGVPNHNSIIKFSFKMDDTAKGLALSYNSGGGHLFRILLNGEGLSVVKDVEKDKSAKKPKGKAKAKSAPTQTAAVTDAPKAKKEPKGRPGPLAKADGKIAPGEWHTLLVEVQGTKVTVQTDTGLKAEAENSELDVEKTGYRFVTAASIVLDDIKVWQAE